MEAILVRAFSVTQQGVREPKQNMVEFDGFSQGLIGINMFVLKRLMLKEMET